MNAQPQQVVPDKASSKAIAALVLGILGIACCGLCAPFAWVIGSAELKQIKAGLSSQAGKGFAQAGMIMGIIGTILLILTIVGMLIYFLFFVGLAATHMR
ncbi:MAG: DUF4190 domain-containing protein [bacterium]|nr:DUF4190 domain-containing protein [bacterium]